ncbi:hypothetical protein TURU_101853 [Turdus rufiventris]|nr:hypothetical protein TURU_101853 [Turdus rufiventris]
MGNKLSSEEKIVLSTWKSLLKRKGIETSDYALCSMLLWAKSQDFETDVSTAFSVSVWKDVGKRLWDVISKGDKSVADLAGAWRLLYETLKDWKTEQDGREWEVEEESEEETEVDGEEQESEVQSEAVPEVEPAGVTSVEVSPGSVVEGNKQETDNISRYLFLKDYVKPVYPSPAQHLAKLSPKSKYITLAQQLAETTLQEKQIEEQVELSAPPLPSKLYKQIRSLTLYPPLPDSDSEDDEAPVIRKSELVHASVCGKSSNKSKPAAPWTLPPPPPPHQVTVIARHPSQFWEHVKKKAAEVGVWDLTDKIGPPKILDMQSVDMNVACKEPMAFPVFKAVPNSGQNDSHQVFAWKVVQDLQTKVAEFGINSQEVMQLISVINADVLAPYDIMHLATILLQPVQYSVFQNTWRQLAEQKALENMQLPQQDPCHALGVDALLGTVPFINMDLQARWDSLVLAKAQQLGMSALIKIMEMAALKQRYVTIQQGNKEPFLQFVEKVAAAVEKQVDDENLRQIICKQLTRDNVNEDCQKNIESLPGDPLLADIVTACSKIGTVKQKMAAFAAVLRPSQKRFSCGEPGHLKAQCPHKYEQKVKLKINPSNKLNRNRCGKPGHISKSCRSKYHANGQQLQGNGKTNVKGCMGTQIP